MCRVGRRLVLRRMAHPARHPARLVWLLALVPAFAGCVQARREARTAHGDAPLRCGPPVALVNASDPVGWAAGLPDLETCEAPPGYREVRVTTWLAIAYPSTMVRLVEYRGAVTGAVYLGYPAGLDYERRVREMYPACIPGPGHAGGGACRLPLNREPDWPALLAVLDGEDVWSLPPHGPRTERERNTVDGWGISVRLRRGGEYRQYAYTNPDSAASPARGRIARIAAAVEGAVGRGLEPGH